MRLSGGLAALTVAGLLTIAPAAAAETGTVKFFNEAGGYGLITPDAGGLDSFVSIAEVQKAGLPTLSRNQRISYDVVRDKRGKQSAVNLAPAD